MATKCIKNLGLGQRCTRPTMAPNLYCWQHQPGASPTKLAISYFMDGTASGKGRKPTAAKKTASAKKAVAVKKSAPAKKAATARNTAAKKVVV